MPRGWAKRWLAAWLGAAALGVANGALREGSYGRRLEQRTAQQLSGVTLSAALALYFWRLNRRWPIPTGADAARIGAAWVALTVAFEFGLGRAQGQTWSEMLAAYDLAEGQSWPLVLAWIGVGPAAVRRLQARW